MSGSRPTLAVIGGTGALGSGLARRAAKAGYEVVIGSRSAGKAQALARTIGARGTTNAEAAAAAGMVALTVPFSSHAAILEELAPHVDGKIVVDATVPLVPPKVARVQLPPEGSAAVRTQAALPGARVVSAFHNVSAEKLGKDGPVDCDVLVFGDDVAARGEVVALVQAIGLRGLHGGPLVNSAAAEAMTSVLIAVNRRYKVADGAGIRITGDLADEGGGA
jgi:8-hydroxy-5-deazaflavin:NADPH oxidoreductase